MPSTGPTVVLQLEEDVWKRTDLILITLYFEHVKKRMFGEFVFVCRNVFTTDRTTYNDTLLSKDIQLKSNKSQGIYGRFNFLDRLICD